MQFSALKVWITLMAGRAGPSECAGVVKKCLPLFETGSIASAAVNSQVTCGSKPGVGGIFFPALALFCYMLFVLRS